MTAFNQLKKSLSKFHNDERGFEALQTVMILAMAAVALITVKSAWGDGKTTGISGFFVTNVGKVTGATN